MRCDVMLLVICAKSRVASWCAQPITMGHPGWSLVPVVLGPDSVPVVTEPDLARQDPELAVLSALAHGGERGGEAIAYAAIEGAGTLDDDKAKFYTDLVLMVLPEAARSALEAMMVAGNYEYQSELVKRWVREVQQGKAEGKAEGEAEGEAKGKAEGEAKGKADSILELLEVRGVSVSEPERERIATCRDLSQLSTWLRRAAFASCAAELFG